MVGTRSGLTLRFLDQMFETPVFNLPAMAAALNCSYQGAYNISKKLIKLNVLEMTRFSERKKYYFYQVYLDLFSDNAG